MKSKILLVDDSALARRSMREILEPAGYDVVDATEGMSALEKYFLEKPDLVLLDLVMRDMNGFEVLARLREMDPAARVVVISADVQTSSHEMAAAAGARAFVTKPVNRASVLRTVAEALEAQR